MPERLLNATEIGAVLGVSARSVIRQVELGRLPAYRPTPRRLAFNLDEVLDALRVEPDQPANMSRR
jgi:hypothetical protein